MTGRGTVGGLCMEMVQKYGIHTEDMLMLWEGMKANADEAARSGFRDGFQMAQAVLGSRKASEGIISQDPAYTPMDGAQILPDPHPLSDQAFIRMEQSKTGKRLHFNKVAGGMLGTYPKADIFVKDGNLIIYPTNDGAYTVIRSPSSGHVQICCADILDKLVTDRGNYTVEKRDNHMIARAPIR